jgi:glycosyltransferase involved in cell wall biosynthesis
METSTRPPIRVLHVESGQEWRATRDQVRLLVDGLRACPWIRQAVATLEGSRLAVEASASGVPTFPLPWTAGTDPRALRRLARACRAGWDVLHAHDVHALRLLIYIEGLLGSNAALVAARRVGGPLVSRWKWHRADLVLASSHGARLALLAGGIEPRRIALVPDGVDVEEIADQHPGLLREAAGARSDHLLVGSLAALEPDRDHLTLVRAAGRVVREIPETRFALFGQGAARPRIEREVEALGLGGLICLPGYLADARRSIRDLSVVVLPSRDLEMSASVLEALAAGVPVVMPADGHDGRLRAAGIEPVTPGDPDAMARAIADLLRDPDRRKRAASRGRAYALAHGSTAMVSGTLRAYEAVRHCRRPA